jgi:hypothetical protein
MSSDNADNNSQEAGPHYLLRFATEKTRTDNVVAKGGNAQLFNLQDN